MGCCVSSNKASSLRKDHDSVVVEKPSENSRAIPLVEEETVKEVLSETPKRNPTIPKSEPQKPHQNITFDKFEEEEESKVKKKALPINKAQEEDISEVSEACSLSETVSTTTITDEGEETRKRVNGSLAKVQKNLYFSGDLGGKRERRVHGSRNVGVGSVRLVQCRDQMGQKMGNGEIIMRNQPRREDAGQNYFRRSRFPATCAGNGEAGSVVGRSPSARRINRSHARVGTAPPENGCRKMGNPTVKGERHSANESLENPLVSLECFIFI